MDDRIASHSVPRRFAIVAALWTGQHVHVLAFAARGSTLDLALRARSQRFRSARPLNVCTLQ